MCLIYYHRNQSCIFLSLHGIVLSALPLFYCQHFELHSVYERCYINKIVLTSLHKLLHWRKSSKFGPFANGLRHVTTGLLAAWTSGLIGLSFATCRWSDTQLPDSSPTSAFADCIKWESSMEVGVVSSRCCRETRLNPSLMKSVLISDSIPEKCTKNPLCMKVVGPQGHRVLCWQSPSVPYASVPVIIGTVTPIVMAKMPLSGYFPACKLCYLYTFGFSEGEVWTFSFSMCEPDPRNWEQNVLTFSSSSLCCCCLTFSLDPKQWSDLVSSLWLTDAALWALK